MGHHQEKRAKIWKVIIRTSKTTTTLFHQQDAVGAIKLCQMLTSLERGATGMHTVIIDGDGGGEEVHNACFHSGSPSLELPAWMGPRLFSNLIKAYL